MRGMSRRWGLIHAGIAAALAALVLITCSAALDDSGGPEGVSLDTLEPSAPSGSTPPQVRFATLPPGAALPTDARCAATVSPAKETVPENTPFNTVAGDKRLPPDFFTPDSGDPRANTAIASRVTGAYTGTTRQILQWAACKWGIDERFVRAQAAVESSWRQTRLGDWSSDGSQCAPDHELGKDGRDGQCPESFGILQVRYQYYAGAFPGAMTSTAFNADTTYAVWRACYEGYETWLGETAPPDHPYVAGDAWGCLGRWFSGQWYDDSAQEYISAVRDMLAHGRTTGSPVH